MKEWNISIATVSMKGREIPGMDNELREALLVHNFT